MLLASESDQKTIKNILGNSNKLKLKAISQFSRKGSKVDKDVSELSNEDFSKADQKKLQKILNSTAKTKLKALSQFSRKKTEGTLDVEDFQTDDFSASQKKELSKILSSSAKLKAISYFSNKGSKDRSVERRKSA